MSMAGEIPWGELARTWQSGPAVIDHSAIRRVADRQTMQMRISVVGEVALSLAAVVLIWWIGVERGAAALGWAIAAGLHTAVVWAFSIWNRIGIWRPLGRATVDYLRLTQERCRRQRRSATFALWLVGVEVLALMAWLGVLAAEGRAARLSGRWVPAAVVMATAAGWAVWYRARTARRLARLEALDTQLAREGRAA
jgi:hypothetical protein